MEQLLEQSAVLVRDVETAHRRYFYPDIGWNNRLIGIKGARGTAL